jgi:hypothetical protein
LASPNQDDIEFIQEREKIMELEQPGKIILRWQNAVDPFGPEDQLQTITEGDRNKAQVLFDKVDEWKWEFWNPESKKFDEFNSMPELKYFYYAVRLTLKYRDRKNNVLEVKKIIRNPYPWSRRINLNATPIPTPSPTQAEGAN